MTTALQPIPASPCTGCKRLIPVEDLDPKHRLCVRCYDRRLEPRTARSLITDERNMAHRERDERNQRILKMDDDGFNMVQISKELNVSRRTVARVLSDHFNRHLIHDTTRI